MAAPKQHVAIGIWKRYEAYDFEIAPSLAGASHEFRFRGLDVAVRIPKRPLQRDRRNEDSPITCSAYRTRQDRKVPLSYNVHQVDTYLNTGETRKVPDHALGTVNVSLFSKLERERLDRVAHHNGQILEEAFQYWIDVLRWKSGVPTLRQFRYNRQRTTWGTYLLDVRSKKRFYAPPHVFVVEGRTPVTKRSWSRARQALSLNSSVPLWHTYIAEASQKLRLGDTRGFIIDLAIASETLIRQLTNRFLKSPVNPSFQSMVNYLPISRLLDDWYRLGFKNAEWKRLKPEKGSVKRVIDLRNAIMHRGEDPGIGTSVAHDLGAAVLRFVTYGERQIG